MRSSWIALASPKSSAKSSEEMEEPNYDSVNSVASFITRIKNDEMISQDEINAAMSSY